MTNRHGTPIWYELLTSDADAGEAFYHRVVGWSRAPSPPAAGGMDYRIQAAPDGEAVAGLMKMPDGMGSGPAWMTYFGVDDVDAAVAAIAAAGGSIHMPATTMEGIGRMAMAADPWGASFYVMRGESDEDSTSFLQSCDARPGHAVWNELTTPAQDEAIAFYAEQFGWTQDGAMPMGPLGDYKFLKSGDDAIGAAMGPAPNGRPGWQPYFMADDIDAAMMRLKDAGGSLVQGPDEIPGGGFAVVADDPQGARFGLVGDRKAQGE